MAAWDLRSICNQFDLYGDYVIGFPFGTGHINDTFCVAYNQGGTIVHYTIQRINHRIFQDPVKLMENVGRVTAFQAERNAGLPDAARRSLRLLRSRDGKPYVRDAEGNWFRGYVFVENCRTYDVLENDRQAFEAARAFGAFQQSVAGLPGGRLHETIPAFHDTPSRLAALEAAIKADAKGRAKAVTREIDFVRARAGEVGKLIALQQTGELPERITHNDTKLNNVLLDDFTGEGLCVIDLDTVMPGLVHYDFGDMVRTGTSPAAEDEPDASKVTMQFSRFEALLRGFLTGAGNVLTPAELEYLPFAGKLITLEIGIRFLTDYLAGDVYFKIHREDHNLDRCRTQFALVSSIEAQMGAMETLLHQLLVPGAKGSAV